MASRAAAPVASTSGRVHSSAYAGRVPPKAPRRMATVAGALPRAEGSGHLFYSRLLRTHRQRLEHLVSSGATSAADLAPVVSELRQIAAEVPTTDVAWARMREQLLALERALAAASAPGSEGLGASSSSSAAGGAISSSNPTPSSSSSSSSSSGGGPASSRRRRAAERVTVRTAAGACVDLAIPDLDCHQPLAPACVPRLAAVGQVLVCTGRKCCQQGAMDTLAAARVAAEGSDVEVVATKCMGKCGKGPCVKARVEGREGTAVTKGVGAAAAEMLLRQQFGVTC